MLTVIVENGTGVAGANSYVSVVECDAYHESHLYPAAWNAATADQKKAAVVMATRAINGALRWNGLRKSDTQGLEWPRYVAQRIGGFSGIYGVGSPYWPDDAVPQAIKDATCEMARLLLIGDRTAETGTEGIKRLGLGDGAIDIEFDGSDRPRLMPPVVLAMLEQFGFIPGGGMVPVGRVQ